ncbi:BTB domain-containing protein [Mycena kentingensis (nom. inval.)]|nr:BTB domain-containing protein [Mycena kentingensis (nom. inval.)]
MSTGRRPAKRARDQVSEAPEITRSPDYWLEDGSIVLQVESTQFRIAKTTLAKHSAVFQTMLSLPLPGDEPLIEGCPVVVLSGDSAVDWKHLLDVMHPKRSAFLPEHASADQLRAVLQLSKKYEMSELRQSAVEVLRSDCPATFDAYDKSPDGTGRGRSLRDIVAIARATGVYSALPVAFYLFSMSFTLEAR